MIGIGVTVGISVKTQRAAKEEREEEAGPNFGKVDCGGGGILFLGLSVQIPPTPRTVSVARRSVSVAPAVFNQVINRAITGEANL